MKSSFVIYTAYADQMELLNMEQRGVLFTALMAYAAESPLPDMDGMTKMAFSFIRSQMDRDTEKYQKVVTSRREAGKKGGRPPKEKPENPESSRGEEEPGGFSEKQAKAKKANGSSEKQTETKKANGFSEKQKNPVYVYENDNEYEKDKKIKTSCPEPEKSAPGTRTVIAFPLNDGSMYGVTENDVARYQQLYPGIDCMQELRKIVGWCESNPKNRKTSRGAQRFVNGWLARAQDRAPTQKGPPKSGPPNRFHNFDPVGYDYDAIAKELST